MKETRFCCAGDRGGERRKWGWWWWLTRPDEVIFVHVVEAEPLPPVERLVLTSMF